MTPLRTLQARVQRGALSLDGEFGFGWADKIDLSTLDLISPCHCILGQLFGDFWESDNVTGTAIGPHAKAIKLGFTSTQHEQAFLTLERLWIHQINKRKGTTT